MYYEGTIKLERGDRDTLLADLEAVERLLSERKTARVIRAAESIFRRQHRCLRSEQARTPKKNREKLTS